MSLHPLSGACRQFISLFRKDAVSAALEGAGDGGFGLRKGLVQLDLIGEAPQLGCDFAEVVLHIETLDEAALEGKLDHILARAFCVRVHEGTVRAQKGTYGPACPRQEHADRVVALPHDLAYLDDGEATQ